MAPFIYCIISVQCIAITCWAMVKKLSASVAVPQLLSRFQANGHLPECHISQAYFFRLEFFNEPEISDPKNLYSGFLFPEKIDQP